MPGKPCPWCSAPVPDGSEHCPSCQAALVDHTGGTQIPGVTQVDPQVIAEEAMARKLMQRARTPKPGVVGRTFGGVLGGSLGAAVGGAIEAALTDRPEASPPIQPTGLANLAELDARLGRMPPTGLDNPGTFEAMYEPSPDPRLAPRPNEIAGMVEPNVVHWPGAPEPGAPIEPAEASWPADVAESASAPQDPWRDEPRDPWGGTSSQ
jgi:hypothetical protein